MVSLIYVKRLQLSLQKSLSLQQKASASKTVSTSKRFAALYNQHQTRVVVALPVARARSSAAAVFLPPPPCAENTRRRGNRPKNPSPPPHLRPYSFSLRYELSFWGRSVIGSEGETARDQQLLRTICISQAAHETIKVLFLTPKRRRLVDLWCNKLCMESASKTRGELAFSTPIR